MKFLAFIFVLSFYQLSFASSGFVEGQMSYKVLPDGSKDFSYRWDKQEGFLQVRLGLVWQNYEEALHGNGFNLSNVAGTYQIFPDPPENCSFYKAHGSIVGKADLNNNEVFVEYKGSGCLDMISRFGLGTFVIHFYEVHAWDSSAINADVFRLQIWDRAP